MNLVDALRKAAVLNFIKFKDHLEKALTKDELSLFAFEDLKWLWRQYYALAKSNSWTFDDWLNYYIKCPDIAAEDESTQLLGDEN